MNGWADIPWEVVAVAAPLLLAVGCFALPRQSQALGLLGSLATLLAGVGLAGRVWVHGAVRHEIGDWSAPLGIALQVDGLGATAVLLTGLVGALAAWHASGSHHKSEPARAGFWSLWCFLLASLNALFVSGDLFNHYVALELTGLSGAALVAMGGTRDAAKAAFRYLLLSLGGALCFLLAVGLLYSATGTLDLRTLTERSPAISGALGVAITALAMGGLVLKAALFPMHFWLPPAHGAAPAPVSAALSGLVVKAAFVTALRTWAVLGDSNAIAALLGGLGVAAIVWGSVQALLARRLKMLVAHSTVAQVGYLFVAFPLLGEMSAESPAVVGVVFHMVAHCLAKAALFLSAGCMVAATGRILLAELGAARAAAPLSLAAFALAGVSLAGLPLSGGFLAKWKLVEASLATGQWWWAVAVIGGGLLTGAYVLRVLLLAFAGDEGAEPGRPQGLRRRDELPGLILALLAVGVGFVGPWLGELLQRGGVLQATMAAGGGS